MKLHCPSCGTQIPARHVNLARTLASCPTCHEIFDFSETVGGGASPKGHEEGRGEEKREKRTGKARPSVELPATIHVQDAGKTLHVSLRWRHWKFYPLAFFCVLWDGFMIFWFTMAIASGAWPMALFGSLHAAVGVALTYYTVCGFVNRTTVYVGDGRIAVAHEPLPWPGARDIALDELEQLFCEERIHRTKNGTSYTYELHAILRDGNRIKLLSGLNAPEEAFFLEQEMERFLGIEDRAVPGELEG